MFSFWSCYLGWVVLVLGRSMLVFGGRCCSSSSSSSRSSRSSSSSSSSRYLDPPALRYFRP